MKKFFSLFLVLLFSFTICFSSINTSYADSTGKLTTKFKIKSDVVVRDEGTTSSKKIGTLKKGQTVYIKVFERNKTGSWWCKIKSAPNSKFVNEWIYSGAIDFPFQSIKYVDYVVTSDYSSIPVYKSYSSNSGKVGSLPKWTIVTFDQFKTSQGNTWGRISEVVGKIGTSGKFDRKWINMKYMNFSGGYITTKNNVAIKSGFTEKSKTVYRVGKGSRFLIKRIEQNQYGNWWCKTGPQYAYINGILYKYTNGKYDGKWIYSGHLSYKVPYWY